jgi:RNA polymerase sigma factor (sigma-70 family)
MTDASTALVRRAADGDPEAKRALVSRLLPVVRARVRRLQAKRGDLRGLDLHDVVQHVWVVLLTDNAHQLRQWDPARGATLEGYVGMVTEREVGNNGQRWRARARHESVADEVMPEGEQPSTEAASVAKDLMQQLQAFLQRELSPKGMLVFRCLYTDGLEPDEAAEVLGVNRQVIYNWQHKIRGLARAFEPSAA